jgi:colanic acid biosynthesis glycosyl transferase WcaI
MNIQVVTPYYLPDGGPSAPLFAMLCETLARRGHHVTVVAAVPHYPSGRVPAEFRGWRTRKSLESGVHVIRVPVPSLDRSRLGQRFLQFAIYQLNAARLGLMQDCDVAICSNPALMTGLPLAVLTVLRRKPAIFSVHDVYPDVGISLGILRNPTAVWGVTALERFCLHHAARVRILAESFAPAVRNLRVPDSKLVLIYDWVDTDLIRPLSRANAFARENGLVDRFVVLYAGNIGLSQGLETVLRAAQQVVDYPDIEFVFVGDGTAKERLVAQADELKLQNVRFLPFQPRLRLPEVLATADVSLVMLQRGIGIQSLPSKSFSILASGRPLVSSVDEDSDMSRLVQRSEAGLCVPPEDPNRLVEAILHLRANPALRERMGRSGRAYALQHHSPESAAAQFESILRVISGVQQK